MGLYIKRASTKCAHMIVGMKSLALSVVRFGSGEVGKCVSEPKMIYLAVTRFPAHFWDFNIEVGKYRFGVKCAFVSSVHDLLF